MKFRLSRTSSYSRNDSPHPRAVKEGWGWVIEIESLDSLMSFIHEIENEIVVNYDPPSIEIYDDYRE